MEMQILFVICGRAGSKGIKNKNIRDFLGKPLALYTLSAADLYLKRHSEVNGDIVLNTDSEKLVHIFENNKIRKVEVIHRSPELSGDLVPKWDVLRNSLLKMEEKKMKAYDMVIDLDITSPLRTVSDMEHLIEMKTRTRCDVVFSVTDSRRNPYFNMVKKTGHGYKKVMESNFKARQQAPEIFDMNASMYAYSPEHLKAGKGVFDGYVEVIKMLDTGILDLDHEGDFELMQIIAGYLYEKMEEFGEISRFEV